MARSRKHHVGEVEDGENLSGNGNGATSSHHKVKVDEEFNRLEKRNADRSKHSETEQRRRSKINERFQVLRDIIPQNDQKRDKASLLMEVIDYIQFLQEKLRKYEGSQQGWSQEPTKLIPWLMCQLQEQIIESLKLGWKRGPYPSIKCHRGPAENIVELSQIAQNGSSLQNQGSPELFANVHNPLESCLFTAAVDKVQSPLSATEAVSLNMHMQPNFFDAVMRSGLPTDHLQEPLSNIDCMPSQSLLFGRPNVNDSALSNGTSTEDAFPTPVPTESGVVSISSAYSQGVLDTLKQALQSSSVDLSHANITVQLDIEQRANTGFNTSVSKMHINQSFGGQTMPHTGIDNSGDDSEPAVKRPRTQAS